MNLADVVQIAAFGQRHENTPSDLCPGDSIIVGTFAITLLQLLLDDGDQQTWEAMVSAHADVDAVGERQLISFSISTPLSGSTVVRSV